MQDFIASLSPNVVAAGAIGLLIGLTIIYAIHRIIGRIRRLFTAACVAAIAGGTGGSTVGPQLLQALHLPHFQ